MFEFDKNSAKRSSAVSRWLLIALLVVPTRNHAAVWGAEASSASGPNVVFLISDDLGAQSLGCYGNKQCRTPHIDRLASEAVRFESAYCQFPVCGPSRAALMSGMYPQCVGVTGNGSSKRLTEVLGDRPSMAQHFKNHGYYTARVSKIYHMRVPGDITAGVDGPDHTASWTERFNCQGPEWMSAGEHLHLSNESLQRQPDKHYNLGFGGAFYVVRGSTDGSEQPDVQAATKAIELLEQHRDKPFFLAVGFVRPHVPLVAPARFFADYTAELLTLPMQLAGDWGDIPRLGISKNSRGSGLDSSLKKQQVLEAYYASVTFMDAQVGRILDALDRLQLRRNTIVVFTSDHGYHLGEHEFWQKMSLHEESTRIPLIISPPPKDDPIAPLAATVTSAITEQIDIYPTLAELAGLPVPPHCQGTSLVPTMRGDPKPSEFAYCFHGSGHLLRSERYAYMRYRDGSEELYDMQSDPQQFHNVVGTREDAAQRMQVALEERLKLIQQASPPDEP